MPIPSTSFQPPTHIAPSPIPTSSSTTVVNDPLESSIRARYLRTTRYSRYTILDMPPWSSAAANSVRRTRTLRRDPVGSHDTHPHNYSSTPGSYLHSPSSTMSERQIVNSISLPSRRDTLASLQQASPPPHHPQRHYSPVSSFYTRFHPTESRIYSPTPSNRPYNYPHQPIHRHHHRMQPSPSRSPPALRSSSDERMARSAVSTPSPMEGEVSTFGGFTANPGSQVVEFHHPFQYGLDGNSSAMTVESSNSNAAEWQVRPVTPSASSISSATNINSDVSQPDTVVHATSTAHSSQRTSVDDRLTLRHLRVSAFSSHSSLSDTAPVACESEDTIMEQDVTPIPTSTAFAPAGYALSSEEPARDSEQGRQTYMEDSARSDSRGDGDHDDEDDVDDDDDGIDLVIQSRQNLVPETRSFVASAPPMFSTASLHPVEHAQLSPRSAAALTSSMHAGRSSWGEPSQVTSSITNQLPAMTRQQQTHNYENNPYFRRASISILTNHYDSTTAGMPSPMTQEHGFESEQSVNDVSSSSVNSHSEPHCSDGSRPLSFEVVYADGGDFNESHSVDNVLKNDGTVYCSRRSSNINICLKLAEAEQSFVLTGFKARAPTSGFTAPCKEGLIFVSHDPIPLERVSVFDNMTKDRYDEYMRRMTHEGGIEAMLEKHGANFVDSFMPAAFFQLESPEESCSIEFNPARSGRYVLIKLLRARGVNSECPENIDVQYLGLYGYTGTRSFASGQLL